MPSHEDMVRAVERYVEAFDKGDAKMASDLYADNAPVEDPIGLGRGAASRPSSVSRLTSSTVDHPPASISSAKDDESACYRFGRRQLPQSVPGSELDPRMVTRHSS